MTKKKKIIIICISIVVFLLALGMTLYPLISNKYIESHQSEIHSTYEEEMQQVEDTKIKKARESAKKYNEQLTNGVMEYEAFSKDGIGIALETYADQLNLTGNNIMCYIEIPRMGVTLPVYHGTSDATLSLGIGHLVGSSLPIGGESTHSIMTGHSGMASQKMFSDLMDMQKGDIFYIDVLNETLAYRVDQIVTILPDETEYLQIEPGKDLCTLITCTPFGVNTHRLLVRGTRIPYVEEEKMEIEKTFEEEKGSSTWEQQYMSGLMVGAIMIIIGGVSAVVFTKVHKKKSKKNKTEDTPDDYWG